MFLNNPQPPKCGQQGSMLVTALVVAVLLLALGLALSRVISAGAQQNAVEYYGARSYLAAQSGVQRSLQTLLSSVSPNCAVINGSNYTFESEQLRNCDAAIRCNSQNGVVDPSVGSGSISVFSIESAASCNVADITTARTVVVEVRLED